MLKLLGNIKQATTVFLNFFSTSRIICDIFGPCLDCGLVTAFDNPFPCDTANAPKKEKKGIKQL